MQPLQHLIRNLRTDFVRAPIGVESASPVLSWELVPVTGPSCPGSYRIEVAASEDSLANHAPDLWDSGRVVSDQNVARYQGEPLTARQICHWRVTVWDDEGQEWGRSEPAFWEMGLMNAANWSAEWLAVEDRKMKAERLLGCRWIRALTMPEGGETRFRLTFRLYAAATVHFHLTAFGPLSTWIDGQESGGSQQSARLAVGPQPAIVMRRPLSAGLHVLAVSLGEINSQHARFGFPAHEIALFTAAEQQPDEFLPVEMVRWRSALSTPEPWQSAGFQDEHWPEPVIADSGTYFPWAQHPAFYLKRGFALRKPWKRARLYAAALGSYELTLNGTKIGDAVMLSESTDFRKRVWYSVHDVTDLLQSGDNVVGALVGDGWYASYSVVVGRYPWLPPPRRFLLQLEIQNIDGSTERICSGPGWKIRRSPILTSEIYDGEFYDSRLEVPDWSLPSSAEAGWDDAETVPAPLTQLTSHLAPPIRRTAIRSARTISEIKSDVHVFDFGQNLAGWCRLAVTGPAGSTVVMRFAEVLAPDGQIDQSNLRSARQTDSYVLKGHPDGETFEPHFTYHGFRYVQVTGLPRIPAQDTLTAVVLHSDLEPTGTLELGDPTLQAIWRNGLWSQRSNFMGIPTDCPQRDERLGWMGDANVFWDAAAFNMDVAAFTRRFMNDVRDSQAATGSFAEFSPAAYKDPEGGGIGSPSAVSPGIVRGAAPGWADAGITLPWTTWRHYADTAIIDENWEAMARHLAFVLQLNPDYVWRHGRGADYGDWLALDAREPGDPTTPKDLIGTALWAHSARCMMEMAQATGRAQAAEDYRTMAATIAKAFQGEFVRQDGRVGNGSQTGYILGLRFDLIPQPLRAPAAAWLAADIERRGNVLSTGFLGTPFSLDVLADCGHDRLVYSLLLKQDYPSWGYMVAKGATTLWERWNSDQGDRSMNSFNHYALGAVGGFLFRRIAGIAPLEAGFRKIEMKPLFDARLARGGADYKSVRGSISAHWQRGPSGVRFDVTVPALATAVVHFPATGPEEIAEKGRPISDHAAIKLVGIDRNRVMMELRPGSYSFHSAGDVPGLAS